MSAQIGLRFGDGRSPHGERGLKFGWLVAFAVPVGRSPHGERGLKCRQGRM